MSNDETPINESDSELSQTQDLDNYSLEDCNSQYTKRDFENAIDEVFDLQRIDLPPLPLKLVALEDSRFDNPGFIGFSLYFAPPENETQLPNDSYFLKNKKLGLICIHLSATLDQTGDQGAYTYEAVFNLKL